MLVCVRVLYCNCRLIFGACLCMCAFNFYDFIVLSFVLPLWRNKDIYQTRFTSGSSLNVIARICTILRLHQNVPMINPTTPFVCNPSTTPFFTTMKHVTITAKSSFEKNIFDLIYKYVVYIVRFLTRLTSISGTKIYK